MNCTDMCEYWCTVVDMGMARPRCVTALIVYVDGLPM